MNEALGVYCSAADLQQKVSSDAQYRTTVETTVDNSDYWFIKASALLNREHHLSAPPARSLSIVFIALADLNDDAAVQ